jgi:hypothetical protein
MSAFRHGVPKGLAQIRANPLETILIAFAAIAIAIAMGATARVALTGDRTQDLGFTGTTDGLSGMIANHGSDGFGRIERATLLAGHGSAQADTIVATADSTIEPAFATGGFIHDQIANYNNVAVSQAVRIAFDSSAIANGPSAPPTLLQTAWTDEGQRVLSDRVVRYRMSITSPYAEGTWREVRTIDWRSSPAMLGLDGEIPLLSNQMPGLFRARLNGRDCGVNKAIPNFYLYCTSVLAADANKFYDFGLRVAPSMSGGRFVSGGPYRPRNVWMNGRSETFGQRPVSGGDLFDANAVGPFLLSAAEWGTLAAEQWVNGRRTFVDQRLGTLSFFARAGRSSTPATDTPEPLVLGFDEGLNADLEREAARFLKANEHMLKRLAIVVVDVRTGEVRAIAEPARTSVDEPLLSFEPILVGSVVKPILAAAILSRHPELGDLHLAYAGDTVREVGGIRLRKGFANEANGCRGEIGFNDFIRCSSNQFAAELMVRSLELDGLAARSEAVTIPKTVLDNSAIANGLARLFDVDALAQRTAGRLPSYWALDSVAGPAAVSSMVDRSLIPYESRPWILLPSSNGTRVDLIARYAFGGWLNRWTLLGLAQSYARIASSRDVQVTFLHRPELRREAHRFPAAGPMASDAFERVRDALAGVGVNGTAAGLTKTLRDSIGQHVSVFAKTGTLNENVPGGRLKSLAIAVGAADSAAVGTTLSCGLVAVTFFEFNEREPHSALPRVHRDFAEGPFASVLGKHWNRVTHCSTATSDVRLAGTQSSGAKTSPKVPRTRRRK